MKLIMIYTASVQTTNMHVKSQLIVWNEVKEIAMLVGTAKFVGGNWTCNKKPIGGNCHKLVVTTLYWW